MLLAKAPKKNKINNAKAPAAVVSAFVTATFELLAVFAELEVSADCAVLEESAT